jgi:hypothetical protein
MEEGHMGYSEYDWFDDHLLPNLKNVMDIVKKKEENKDAPYDPSATYSLDEFVNAIKKSLCRQENDKFVSQMLLAILNPDDENMDISDIVKAAFDKYSIWEEYMLQKIEYRKNISTTVVVNYQDYEKEENF